MIRCFRHRENRGKTGIGSFQYGAPFIAGLAGEDFSQAFLFQSLRCRGILIFEHRIICEAHALKEFGIELRFEAAQRDILSVQGFKISLSYQRQERKIVRVGAWNWITLVQLDGRHPTKQEILVLANSSRQVWNWLGT